MSDAEIFCCSRLSKSFGTHQVLDALELEILQGETIVVLGHSGTGKSVLLKHLNGLIRPDDGEVRYRGTDITALSESQLVRVRREVGMLFQGGAMFDSLDVEDNVAFALDEHHICSGSERSDRVATLLGMVGLEDTQRKMPSELSGGMRKRAALARSLALEPAVVLYDEPTTGLDPVTAQQINELIRDLQDRLGLTSVVVTHDLASAAFVADRMAFLYNGKIRQVGSALEMRGSTDSVIHEFMSAGVVPPAEDL